jgi:hypothetical protein
MSSTIEERNAALLEKLKRMYIPAEDMYRRKPDLYSLFDMNGVPTHDAYGNELSKSTMKKLYKDWEKQKKLYDSRYFN